MTAPLLTQLQFDIVKLMADGHDTADIAATTFWSEKVIRRETNAMMDKLQAKSRAHAVGRAYQLRILRVPYP